MLRFINSTYDKFLEDIQGRKLILFGASSAWNYYSVVFSNVEQNILDKTLFIVDNAANTQDKRFPILGRTFEIKSPAILKEMSDYVLLIDVRLAYHEKICKQLIDMELPDEVQCYSLILMTYSNTANDNSCVASYFTDHKERKIKPNIHTFWFSGEEKPDLYKRCMESWYHFCPDYTITEWNMDNYDVSQNQYMREAIEHRKWAFASDYARLEVLYRLGGVYFDMDVELIASIDHLLRASSFFCRQEDGTIDLGSGFGIQAGDELIGAILNTYAGRRLIKEDGSMDITALPTWTAPIMQKEGIVQGHDAQVVNDRLILSNDFIVCTKDGDPLQKAIYGVHWHNGGWLSDSDMELTRQMINLKSKLTKEYFG